MGTTTSESTTKTIGTSLTKSEGRKNRGDNPSTGQRTYKKNREGTRNIPPLGIPDKHISTHPIKRENNDGGEQQRGLDDSSRDTCSTIPANMRGEMGYSTDMNRKGKQRPMMESDVVRPHTCAKRAKQLMNPTCEQVMKSLKRRGTTRSSTAYSRTLEEENSVPGWRNVCRNAAARDCANRRPDLLDTHPPPNARKHSQSREDLTDHEMGIERMTDVRVGEQKLRVVGSRRKETATSEGINTIKDVGPLRNKIERMDGPVTRSRTERKAAQQHKKDSQQSCIML
ncbi:uncharacterized protein LOC120300802 [Crotalus tigris]|uniref:uncharacterized protein LOC120300802 n=1 Tax=Crotalus tigris TaxID=88082 RepID=UPI00192F2452|nr:uncharacterized protein LOC120300802 [Crotalus tigris]